MIGNDWDEKLKLVWSSSGYKKFMAMINKLYAKDNIYPPFNAIYRALELTSYQDTRVVIVGQDPYHGDQEAHGLSFSVPQGIKIPPSLQNIFKELKNDLGINTPLCGDLTKWAKNGVLLLNAVLTVRRDYPASHRDLGWEKLTDYIIKLLNQKQEPIVFILWGNFAKKKASLVTNPQHLIISSPHPSPFSARQGFFGSKPFSRTNDFLKKNNQKVIDWQL